MKLGGSKVGSFTSENSKPGSPRLLFFVCDPLTEDEAVVIFLGGLLCLIDGRLIDSDGLLIDGFIGFSCVVEPSFGALKPGGSNDGSVGSENTKPGTPRLLLLVSDGLTGDEAGGGLVGLIDGLLGLSDSGLIFGIIGVIDGFIGSS